MPRTHKPYPLEFRQRMVELVRAGRDPAELAKEFEPSEWSIRGWGEAVQLASRETKVVFARAPSGEPMKIQFFPAQSGARVILPMSDFAGGSTTSGTRCAGTTSRFSIATRAAVRRSSSASRLMERARSSPRGCSIPPCASRSESALPVCPSPRSCSCVQS